MGLFNKNTGLMDVIRCDEESYLIEKILLDGDHL